jgi:serine/threonine-protein kinase
MARGGKAAMPDRIPDDAVATFVQQHAIATAAQVETARTLQIRCANEGDPISLSDALIRQGVITAAIKENVEQRIQAQQKGGISQLLHYKLLKKLGEGGMGAVYLADDTLQKRKVALKVLPRHHVVNAEFMKRFQREADAMGRLNHVNIVRAFSVGEDQGRHFIVMEYCAGETLDNRIRRERFIPHAQATGITMQVARGLQYAHAEKLIHRDIKPANIIMAGDVAKILDLGLSKRLEGADVSFLTQSGVAMGTPHYISPEQAKGEKDIDGRTDIYSLGATYYHLVTGDTPFHGSSAFDVVTKHLSEQLPDPRDVRAEIPEGVVHIIRRMMAKDRADRYQRCEDLIGDLQRVAAGRAPVSRALDATRSSVALPAGTRPGRRTAPRPRDRSARPAPPRGPVRKSNPAVFWIGGGIAMAGAALLVLLTLGGGSLPPPVKGTESARQPVPETPPINAAASNPPSPTPPTAKPPEPSPMKRLREDAARKQLEDLKMLASSGISRARVLQGYEGFVDSYGDTEAGEEARGILVKLKAKPPPDAPIDSPERWRDAIDLLSRVDPEADAMNGKWHFQGGDLISDGRSHALLEIPYHPPAEYDIRVAFTRTAPSKESTSLMLCRNKWNFAYIMGGWRNTATAFDSVGGKSGLKNPTGVRYRLEAGRRYVGAAEVRRDRVTGYLDGKQVVEWKPAFGTLKLAGFFRDPQAIGLGCNLQPARFHRVQVREVTGRGRFIRREGTAAAVDAPDRWRDAVDLLVRIDPARDGVNGSWTKEEGALVSPAVPHARIEIPYRPPSAYDFRITFSRREGNDNIQQILTRNGRSFVWEMGGWNNRIFALGLVDGLETQSNPSSNVMGIKNGRRYTSTVQVRPDGIRAYLDGRMVLRWITDYSDLRIHDAWRLRDEALLGLGSFKSITAFHAIEVLEVDGKGTFTRNP